MRRLLASPGRPRHLADMRSLYNVTTTQQAMIEWSRAMRDLAGNLEPSIDIYPDRFGPIVQNGLDGLPELVSVRWVGIAFVVASAAPGDRQARGEAAI